MISPYDCRTEDLRNRIIGKRHNYKLNQYYKAAEGNFYYYINTKGYVHVLKPCCVTYDKQFSHYTLNDFLLSSDGRMKLIKEIGIFKNKQKLMDYILVHKADEDLAFYKFKEKILTTFGDKELAVLMTDIAFDSSLSTEEFNQLYKMLKKKLEVVA